MEPVTDFIFFSSKITLDGEYSHGIKRPLLFGRKALANLDNILGFLGGSVDKESACNAGDAGSIPGLGKIPWRKAWQPTTVFLHGKSHGQRSLAGYNSWGHKESDTTEQLST